MIESPLTSMGVRVYDHYPNETGLSPNSVAIQPILGRVRPTIGMRASATQKGVDVYETFQVDVVAYDEATASEIMDKIIVEGWATWHDILAEEGIKLYPWTGLREIGEPTVGARLVHKAVEIAMSITATKSDA